MCEVLRAVFGAGGFELSGDQEQGESGEDDVDRASQALELGMARVSCCIVRVPRFRRCR